MRPTQHRGGDAGGGATAAAAGAPAPPWPEAAAALEAGLVGRAGSQPQGDQLPLPPGATLNTRSPG